HSQDGSWSLHLPGLGRDDSAASTGAGSGVEVGTDDVRRGRNDSSGRCGRSRREGPALEAEREALMDWERLKELVDQYFEEYEGEHKDGGYADLSDKAFLEDF